MVAKTEHRKRTGCPVACSLDLIGDHWTLLIIRNLMFLGLHEYKDMLATEEQISSSILSDRLKKLEIAGIISSIPHPESGKRKLYYLTEAGKDLLPLMIDIVYWADKHLSDHLRIPEDRRAFLNMGRETMIKMTLEQIDAWEKTHLS